MAMPLREAVARLQDICLGGDMSSSEAEAVAFWRVCQYPLDPNEELDGDPGAALALSRAGMVSSEINAIAVRNYFMAHLLSDVCPLQQRGEWPYALQSLQR